VLLLQANAPVGSAEKGGLFRPFFGGAAQQGQSKSYRLADRSTETGQNKKIQKSLHHLNFLFICSSDGCGGQQARGFFRP